MDHAAVAADGSIMQGATLEPTAGPSCRTSASLHAGELDGCPFAYVRLDAGLEVVGWNARACERLGGRLRPGLDLLAMVGAEAHRQPLLEALGEQGEGSYRLRVEVEPPGGTPVAMEIAAWRHPDGTGDVQVLVVELTEGVQAARRLLQAEKLAGVGRVAAQFAHRLNTPLGSILLTAQALEEDLVDPEQRVDLRLIIEESRRCQRIVRRLQNFSRGGGAVDDRVNFCHLFHRVYHILGHSLEAARTRLDFYIARGRYLVRGDPSELEHLLFALLENALDASPRDGTIRVCMHLDLSGDGLVFQVLDEGPGIPEGMDERIFEPFYTTKEEGRGTGLGLAIARRIVTEHGGRIRGGRRPDGSPGACFEFTLPLSPLLVKARREDPASVEIRAIPFEVLRARARGEFTAGCEVVGVPGPLISGDEDG